jgi:hypothetical protein
MAKRIKRSEKSKTETKHNGQFRDFEERWFSVTNLSLCRVQYTLHSTTLRSGLRLYF